MSLRDPEFCESLEGFIATSELSEEKRLPKHQVCFHRIMPKFVRLDLHFQQIRVAIMQ